MAFLLVRRPLGPRKQVVLVRRALLRGLAFAQKTHQIVGGLHALVGQTQLWNVGNATDYDHPLHLHGFRKC